MAYQLLVHFGYTLMLCALVARDILWLRAILVVAQGILATYAWSIQVYSIASWNVVFVCINVAWVLRILHERRAVRLPPALAALHARHFAALAPPEFQRLWAQGERIVLRDAALARAGERPQALHFVLDGQVRVTREGRELVQLGPGSFVGEMSLLTGEPATADAATVGGATLVRWPIERLHALRSRNPALWGRIQSVLGHDIVVKIQRAASQAAPATG